MNSVDVAILEEVGITELASHWADGNSDRPLDRLERLGLVAQRQGAVSLTPAGAEALTYLAAAR